MAYIVSTKDPRSLVSTFRLLWCVQNITGVRKCVDWTESYRWKETDKKEYQGMILESIPESAQCYKDPIFDVMFV